MTKSPSLELNRFSAAASAGLRVFPVKPGRKEPAVRWTEYVDRAPTPEELAAWDAGDCNVGIICGQPSGIVVLDVDSSEAQAAVDELDLPATPWVRTGKGAHYYFKRPTGGVRNAVGIAGLKLDFRGDGGYVVGHGSIHPSGHRYRWKASPEEIPFAELPAAVVDLMAQRSGGGSSVRPVTAVQIKQGGKFTAFLAKALSDSIGAVQQAEEGSRNDTLFLAGVKLAKDVAGAASEWAPFAEALRDVALKIGLTPEETEATLASCWNSGSTEPTPWIGTARQWIFLGKPEVFYHLQSGQFVKLSAFNSTFISQRVEKGSFANFLLAGGFVDVVHDLDYQPSRVEKYYERDGLTWFNTYKPSDVVAQKGDTGPIEEFISYLVPEPAERDHLLKMIAWTVRYPGRKLRHALLLRSRAQGIGKSMLTEIWGALLGKSNVRKTTTEEVQGQYQGFIKETMLVVLEELNFGVGPAAYNRLKDLITGSEASVNEKFLPVRVWPNVATFVILTNIPTPMIIEDRDRRLFYIDTPAQQREPEYYRTLANWWGENLGIIRGFLDTVDLSEFDPFAAPPMTTAKQRLIADGRIDLVKDLAVAIEERSGVFDRDVVTLAQIETELGSAMRGKTRTGLRKALEVFGAVAFGQQRIPDTRIGGQVWGTPDRASLWAIRNARFWETAGPQERGLEYLRDEGLLAAFAGWPFEIRHKNEWPRGLAHLRESSITLPPASEPAS